MQDLLLFFLLIVSAAVAEHCPSKSARRYYYPTQIPPGCQCEEASGSDKVIQLAECAKNIRTHGSNDQYFAIFVLDESSDHLTSHGAPYGTCFAFSCALPPNTPFASDPRAVTLFWQADPDAASNPPGYIPGDASNCIKDPNSGACGCEVSGSGNFLQSTNVNSCPVDYSANGQVGCGEPNMSPCGYELNGVGVGSWNAPEGSQQCWDMDYDRNNQPIGLGSDTNQQLSNNGGGGVNYQTDDTGTSPGNSPQNLQFGAPADNNYYGNNGLDNICYEAEHW
ncbi:small secreted protein [Macrophomina phaseolina MS6]|uniref:Small secreted protein n=1 Tax=Macrophomina phaseolina (strain MS6) TaxID=1126212 RepID=K2RSS1_MACPH|nr:small secreted protein [Macrophomina phaseolina MS6]